MRTHAWSWVSAATGAWLVIGVAAGRAAQASSQSSATTPSSTRKVTAIKSAGHPRPAHQTASDTSTSTSYPAHQPASTTAKPQPQPVNPPQPQRSPAPGKPQVPPPDVKPQRAITQTAAGRQAAAVEGSILIEGSITALDLTASSPSVQCKVANGAVWTLSLEPATPILKNGKSVTLGELEVGDTAKVRFTMKDGKHLVKTLEVVNVSSVPASSSGSSTAEPTSTAPTR